MKRLATFFALAALALLALSCKKDDPTPAPTDSLVGCWELSSVQTKASVGTVSVNVYIDFAESSFTLYQKLGEGRYTKFTGSWGATDGSVSGKYSNGTSWGPYSYSLSGNSLSLSKGSETDVYSRVDAVPASVTGNVY